MTGFALTLRRAFGGAVLAAALGFVASAASALTVNFDTWITGTNLGNTSLATLTATQNGSDVDITFTNTGIAGGVNAFDTRLLMQYNGSVAAIGFQFISGVAMTGLFKNVNDTAGPWDLGTGWGTAGSPNGLFRLNVGESSSFRLLNASLANLFAGSGSSPFAMIHVQGLTGGGSTKYGGSVPTPPPAPVPLPAAGVLLLAAMGGLGIASRRRKTA